MSAFVRTCSRLLERVRVSLRMSTASVYTHTDFTGIIIGITGRKILFMVGRGEGDETIIWFSTFGVTNV